MKRTYIALSLAISLSIGTYFATAPSAACCGDGAIAAVGATSAGASVSAAIGSATSTIVQMLNQINDTLTNGFGKMYAEQSKQTAAEKVIQEGMVKAQTQLYMEERRADATLAMKLSPRACYEVQAAGAVGEADAVYDGVVQSVNRVMTDRTLYTPNTAGAIAEIYRTHTEKFCSDQDVRLGRCGSAVEADLQNADIRAENLLARDVYTEKQEEGALAFVKNVVAPIPTQLLPKGWEKTPAGKEFIAGHMVEQGRNSVAANSFANMMALRKVQPGLGAKAGLDTADVSLKQLIRAQADGRFLSPQWYKMIGTAQSEHQLLREINKQMAFQIWLDYQTFEQNERLEAVLATDMAVTAKRDGEARLADARRAAARAR